MGRLNRTVLLGVVAALALVLAACSRPQPATPDTNQKDVVSIDGLQARLLPPAGNAHPGLDTESLLERSNFDVLCGARSLPVKQIQVTVADLVDGTLAPYVDVFWVPANWNRDLVLAAHGFLPPNPEDWGPSGTFEGNLSNPAIIATRDAFLCQGYAIGLSQFSRQGFAVQQGIRDTHLLNPIFWLLVGFPRHTYVYGFSMGGLVTVALAEKYPWRYAAAMPTCGPDAGSLFELQYVGNVRMLLGYFAAGTGAPTFSPLGLGGTFSSGTVDPPTALGEAAWNGWYGAFGGELQSNSYWQAVARDMLLTSVSGTVTGASDLGSFAMRLLQVGASPTNEQIGNALIRPMYYWMVGAKDAVDVADGSPFDNAGMAYFEGPTGTTRIYPGTFAGDADAIMYYQDYYQPTGRTWVPMLALHNVFDADVPIESDRLYRRLSADAHPFRPDQYFRLLTPTDDAYQYGHCNFALEQIVAGFDYLVQRSKTGRWPTTLPSGLAQDAGTP